MQEKSSKIFEDSTKNTIGLRINELLKHFKCSVPELEAKGKLGNGTLKGWKSKQLDFSSAAVENFKRTLGLNESWWKTGEGDVFLTPAIKTAPTDNMENTSDDNLYKNLVEANTDYRLVPKIILDQYHIIPKDEIEDRREMIKVITKAKDDLISKYETLLAKYEEDIDDLEKENETLRSQILTGRTQG